MGLDCGKMVLLVLVCVSFSGLSLSYDVICFLYQTTGARLYAGVVVVCMRVCFPPLYTR